MNRAGQIQIEKANEEVIKAIGSSRISWMDVCRAADVVPGLDKNTLFHSGPPLDPSDWIVKLAEKIII